ncbi:hypothetical protein BTR19_19690 [Pseudomonas fluorescens]|nr:hypothetical protein BTR19_19690 [Pseudomonas fluorescens]
MTTATNTAANVETQTAAAGAAVEQIKDVLEAGNTAPENANTEQNHLEAAFASNSLSELEKVELLDHNFVCAIHDLHTRIAILANPENQQKEIDELKEEIAVSLKKRDNFDETFGLMESLKQLESKHKNVGHSIREKLGSDVTLKDVLVAFADDFSDMIETVCVKFINGHKGSKLKHGRVSKGTATTGGTATKKKGPLVVVEYKGTQLEIAEGRGPLPKVMADTIAAFAKEQKKEVKGIKPDFITALKANKVKGVKFIEVKPAAV